MIVRIRVNQRSRRRKRVKRKIHQGESSGTLFHSNSAFCWEHDLRACAIDPTRVNVAFIRTGERAKTAANSRGRDFDAVVFRCGGVRRGSSQCCTLRLELFSIHPYHRCRRRCCRNTAVTGILQVQRVTTQNETFPHDPSAEVKSRKQFCARIINFVQTIFTLHLVCVRVLRTHARSCTSRRESPVAAAS